MAAKHKLTDIEIRALKPKAKHYTISDGGGLSLRVFPNGKKMWIVRKMSGGKSISFSLGSYPEISLASARAQAQEQCANMVDNRQKETPPESMSLKQIYDLWMQSRTIRPNTKRMSDYLLKCYGSLQDMPLEQITPMRARAALSRLLLGKKLVAASQALSMLASLERFACGLGFIESPRLQYVAGTIAVPEPTHFRYLPAAQLPEVYKGLYESRQSPNFRKSKLIPYFLALTLLVCTLLRSQEAAFIKWQDIDNTNQCIIVPARYMKRGESFRVPITAQLRKVLDALKVQSTSDFILPRRAANPTTVRSNALFERILTRAGIIDRLTPHGFRSMARSYFAEQGFDFIASEYCLAHRVENKVQLSYQRTDYLEQRRVIMQKWCDYVESCYLPYFVL